MTRDDVIRLLAFFAEAYPNTRLPEKPDDRINVWFVALSDEPAEAIFEGARLIVQTDEWHPSPARCIYAAVNDTRFVGKIGEARVRRHLERRALEAG